MYGKINIDGSFEKAPNVLKYKSRTYINPSETILLDLGYLPVKEENKPTKHIDDYTATYKIEGKVIVATYRKKESSSVVISGGDGDSLIPVELLATKEKVIYQQDDPISIDDLEVVCYYKDGTNGIITNYTTNIKDIDSSFAGYKPLEITYIHNSVTVKTTVGIVVNNTDSYNSTQLAYKITKAGILTHDLEVVTTNEDIRQYGKLKMRIKAKVVVEQNDSTSYVNLGFGENTVWGTNLIGATKIALKPKQVGEFIVDANMDVFEYDKSNVTAGKTILRFYNNGRNKVQGYFEILDMSLTYVEPVPKVPVDISASKTQSRAIIGEEMITDDISVAVLYNDDTSAMVTEKAKITFPKTINVGNNEILVEYSESNHTISTTIKMYYYKANKTEPDEFHDMTAWEWCDSWTKGINWGNELDSRANKYTAKDDRLNAIPGDSLHYGDYYISKQETSFGQPVATLQNFIDIKNAGFDMVRIPITWVYNSYTEPELDEENYWTRHIGKFWSCRAREVVDMALEVGLKVLIDMHHEMVVIYTNSGNTHERNQVYKDAQSMWTEIAEVFKNYDERVAFEGYNEVDNLQGSFTFGAKAAEEMNVLNQIFVSAVRSTGGNNAKRVLQCPTTVHIYNEAAVKAWTYPEDTIKDHIVLAVHRYAKNFLQDLEFCFTMLEKYSNEYNVPICMTEWGTNTKDGNWEWRALHAQNFMARARYHHLFPVWWDNGSDFELVKRYNTKQNYGHTAEQCQMIIDGIMTGYDTMVAYRIPDEQIKVFDKLDDFTLLWWSSTKGYYNSYWGSATTYIFPVQGGKKFILSADRVNKAVDETVFPAYIIWLIGTKSSEGTMEYVQLDSYKFSWHQSDAKGVIPEDATHAIILSNSPDVNVKDWDKLITNGEYVLNFMQYEDSDIYEDPLTFRTPSKLVCSKTVTEYLTLGTPIDTDDITVEVEYNDGFRRTLSSEDYNIDISNVDINNKGSYFITVSATVENVKLQGEIEIIIGNLLKSIYAKNTLTCKINNGDKFNTDNLILMAVYSDDTESQVLNGYTVDTSNVDFTTEGSYEITITYTEGEITRTCTTYCIVYTLLYVDGVKVMAKDSVTWGDFTTQGFVNAEPNAIKFTSIQQYKYHYILTDAPMAYSTLTSVAEGEQGDFPIYIYSGYYTDFAASNSSKSITSTSKKLSTVPFTGIYDSKGRGWYKIMCNAMFYDGSKHSTIDKSIIPIMHIDSEADLADIEEEGGFYLNE